VIIGVLLVLLAGWLVLILIRAYRLVYQINKNQYSLKIVVILRNQENSLEGFLRLLLYWRNKLWPFLEILMVDDGSVDQTPKILSLLKREVDFPIVNFSSINLTPKDSQALFSYFFIIYPVSFFISPP
jgi:glycosyltransferase involved in cell wall biosynthesis